MRNFPEYLTIFWACALLGAVLTLVNPWLTNEQLKHCLVKTDCKVHFVDPERADLLERAKLLGRRAHIIVARTHEGKGSWKNMKNWKDVFPPSGKDSRSWEHEPEGDLEDDCAILFTSGTTSMPKAVVSTNRSYISNQISGRYAAMFGLLRMGGTLPAPDPNEPQSAALLTNPLFHAAGSTGLMMGTTWAFRKMVLVRKWNLDQAAELIIKEDISQVVTVPSVITDLLAKSEKVAEKLKVLGAGGAPLPVTVPGELAKKMPTLYFFQAYGLTETNAVATINGGADQVVRPESSGLAVPVCELLIVDIETNKVMPTNKLGEIWIRGSNVFKCYYDEPAATEKAITKDGWFKTGDIGYLDKEGFLYVKDRSKDIIIRGGENIHCSTVENALHQHPEITDVAVVGVPDARLGELVTAVVTISSGSKLKESTIIEYAKTKLPWLAIPVMVMLRDQPIERNATGKIMKNDLRPIVKAEWERRQSRAPTSKL